jgi:hypothetical protein
LRQEHLATRQQQQDRRYRALNRLPVPGRPRAIRGGEPEPRQPPPSPPREQVGPHPVGSGHRRAGRHRPRPPQRDRDVLPLTPGEPAEPDIEIWPTSVIVPAGGRIAVTIGGRDFQFAGDGPWPQVYGIDMKGLGIFLHNDPADRPDGTFGGTTTLHASPDQQSYLLLPVVPPG